MATTPSTKYTYEDYVLLPDDGRKKEIIDGELYVTPAPFVKHQAISGYLFGILFIYLRDHPIGRVFSAPIDVVFSDSDIVQPDIIYISNERTAILTEKNVQGSPDLVVEILSEGSRRNDEVLKRKLFERYGVPEYWIADPALETVKVYRLSGSAYERVAELSNETGDTLTTPAFPGLSISLREVFTAT